MGHTINPVTWRLGDLILWNLNLYINKINWNYLFFKFSNYLYIITFYLKYLKSRNFFKKIKFNFYSFKVCLVDKKLIFLINTSIKLKKKKIYQTKIKFSNFFFNFLKIYNYNWLAIQIELAALKDKTPLFLHLYFYLRKIPITYHYFYIKFWTRKLKKELAVTDERARRLISVKWNWSFAPKYRKVLKKIKFNRNKIINNSFFTSYMLNKKILASGRTLKKKKFFISVFSNLTFYLIIIKHIFSIFFILPLLQFFKKFIVNKFIQVQNFYNFNYKVFIYFIILRKVFFSALSISIYLVKKFSSRNFKAKKILSRIKNYLNKKVRKGVIRGYKFSITGRLTKKDRVTYIWSNRGTNPTNTKFFKIDYCSNLFKTKFSIGIIKVWLFF